MPREAPQNPEVEQALLGALLVNNESYFRVSDFLKADHFFEPIHKRVFHVITELVEARRVASPITVKTFLPEDQKIVGNLTLGQYLLRLAETYGSIINVEDYGRMVRDLAIRRSLIGIGEDMVNVAYDADVDETPTTQIEEAERRLFELAERGKYGDGQVMFDDALENAVLMAREAYDRDGHLSGLATGLSDLDAMMGGLQASDLIILAGRPGMGKTALATNVAFRVARGLRDTRAEGVVAFFSLEMSTEQLAARVLSEQASVPSSDIRRGKIDDGQVDAIALASSHLRNLPMVIDDTGGIGIAQLAARVRRIKRQHGLALVIIDYIQLMSGSGRRDGNRVQEVTDITNRLKALAKETGVPIIALSQLSRAVESRDLKRPQLSDLRESGSIEQDADVVLFVYREEYYLRAAQPEEGTEAHDRWLETIEKTKGKADVIIGKQRHGPTGTVRMAFDERFTRFANLAYSGRMQGENLCL
jgi:replicative DNA helicase